VKLVIQFLKQHRIRRVYDVFVGSGTTLAVANAAGMDAVGVDIDPKQCKKARELMI
jgi:DNA modification methylase